MKKLSSLFLALAILLTNTPIRSENWSAVFWMTFTLLVFSYYIQPKLIAPEKAEKTEVSNQITSEKS